MAERIWMTPADFERFREQARVFRTQANSEADMRAALGLHPATVRILASGARPIPKILALACAHYLFAWPVPFDLENPSAGREWLYRNFRSAEEAAALVGMRAQLLRTYFKAGFPIEVARALDWAKNAGDFCPFGEPAHEV